MIGEPSMESAEEVKPPVGGNNEFSKLLIDLRNARSGDRLKPGKTEGGGEIHHDLRGIRFQYWDAPDKDDLRVGVSYEDTPRTDEEIEKEIEYPETPMWAAQLTGKVFENWAHAKKWLRQESARLADEEKQQSAG